MLFASNNNPTANPQSDNFCYECHGSGSAQAVTNHSYSKNFGGGTATLTTIYDAFNASGSSHNLSDVLNHAVGRDIGFTIDMNPCFVCHDQHLAQRNYPVTLSGLGGVKTAIRRPGDLADPLTSTPANLWGDEYPASPGELMLDYTSKYQAPYYYNDPHDPNKYEPANDGTYDGSNLPQFKNFCSTQCHVRDDVSSTEHGTLLEIDWSKTGDQHGKDHLSGDWIDGELAFQGGYTIAPYTNGETYNYVLACTDCHETHGSTNEWLLRTCVNGKDNITMDRWAGDWWDFCTACHVLTGATFTYHRDSAAASPKCPVCHEHRNDPIHEKFF
jgi:hypothetical protein